MIALIIPAYNAASTLPRLLEGLGTVFDKRHILVVDDGSTDGVSDVCRQAHITALRHPENRGKGAALRTGFSWALERGYDAVITMDADGQHDWREIPRLLAAAADEEADILIGSRMEHPTGMPWQRRFSNRFTSALLSWRTGQSIPDSQSGFRFIRAGALSSITLRTSRFETESELLIRAGLNGFRIGSVAISSIYRASGSAIRPFRDSWRFLALMARSMTW